MEFYVARQAANTGNVSAFFVNQDDAIAWKDDAAHNVDEVVAVNLDVYGLVLTPGTGNFFAVFRNGNLFDVMCIIHKHPTSGMEEADSWRMGDFTHLTPLSAMENAGVVECRVDSYAEVTVGTPIAITAI